MGTVLQRVWASDVKRGAPKFVMVAIADHADEEGKCFPSLALISAKTGYSVRHCQRLIDELVRDGEMEVESGGGRKSNLYRFPKYIDNATSQNVTPDISVTPKKVSHPKSLDTNVTPQLQTSPSTPDISVTPDTTINALTSEKCHPTLDINVTSPMTLMSNELTYNIHTSTIEETKSIKNNVTPVGGDTAQTHLLESTPQPTQSGEITVSQSSDQTGITDQPQTPVIEGIATNSDTIQLNSMPSSQNTPPVVPPADAPKVRNLSDHQRMVSEIAKVFGWDFARITKSNKKLLGKVASELREAGATPDDIPNLYAYCHNQGWTGKFTPMALSSQWANYLAQKETSSAKKDYLVDETGMIWHTYVPPPDYKPMFDYDEMNRKFRESVGEIPTPSDEEVEKMTPEERTKNIRAMISEWAKKMEVPVMELDPDDPMNEVLKW